MWQLQSGAAVDTLGGYKIKLPDDTYGNQLVYPDEDITDGVRVEYTSLDEPFVAEALETTTVVASGTGIEFIDGGGFADRITDTAGGLGDLAVDDKIRIIGSASNDGDYTITVDGGAGSISVATGSLTDEDPGESIIIYQIPKEVASPDETSHVNLNRMLSLAVVCYVMAQLAVDPKEQGYYMNLFWRKVGDSESNKRQVATIMVSSPYAIK
ncbi:hypothetical protein CMI47_21830 [Candidatus Pacearchaeota archaeon]|nr:hypothetical protein [Candidatus Pacearchaeota archaeon]